MLYNIKVFRGILGGGGKVNDALMPSIWVFCINLNKYCRKPFFCPNDLLFFTLISVNPGPGGDSPPMPPKYVHLVRPAIWIPLTSNPIYT